MSKKREPKKLKQWRHKPTPLPSQPRVPPKKTGVKLNLGCGRNKRNGYVNIDIRSSVNPDIVHDLTTPLPFKDESVDEVFAKDILEHFPFKATKRIVTDWHRVLRRGGKIYVQCPDMLLIAQRIANGEIKDYINLSYRIYGGQDYSYNYHKAGFTPPALKLLLEEIGFKSTKIKTSGGNITMWAEKT